MIRVWPNTHTCRAINLIFKWIGEKRINRNVCVTLKWLRFPFVSRIGQLLYVCTWDYEFMVYKIDVSRINYISDFGGFLLEWCYQIGDYYIFNAHLFTTDPHFMNSTIWKQNNKSQSNVQSTLCEHANNRNVSIFLAVYSTIFLFDHLSHSIRIFECWILHTDDPMTATHKLKQNKSAVDLQKNAFRMLQNINKTYKNSWHNLHNVCI